MQERRAQFIARLEHPRWSGLLLALIGLVGSLSVASAIAVLITTDFLFA